MTTISTSPPSFDSDRVAEALAAVRRRIAAAGGDVDAVRVVAVTKGFGLDAVLAARAGLSDIGENYAAELLAKAPGPEGTSWHFLGAVQRNKVGPLAPLVSLWQGVARISEAERIARFTSAAGLGPSRLHQRRRSQRRKCARHRALGGPIAVLLGSMWPAS